jgi:RNA polymerase sigma factor (sigma-70 family)
LAEQVAQDAFVAALEQWREGGVPDRPGAWLTTVARRRAVDLVRREVTERSKYELLAREHTDDERVEMDLEELADGYIEDSLLRLMFVCCHPVLNPEARVALTLRVLGGLSTHEIARAQLVADTTVGQRISRAKRALREAGVAFDSPDPVERAARLPSVLEVIYLVFNEGYAATSGPDWVRRTLSDEAMRLGRTLCALVPEHAEAHGLTALMELQASRFRARTDSAGRPVLLLDQDRSQWDLLLVRRGLEGLDRAIELGGGPYTLQAAIAACHGRALRPEDTDWIQLAGLYDALAAQHPSPVTELNRGVAHWKAFGPRAGLALVEALRDDPRLAGYHLLPSVLAEMLADDGQHEAARRELQNALALAENEADRELLHDKLRRLPSDI